MGRKSSSKAKEKKLKKKEENAKLSALYAKVEAANKTLNMATLHQAGSSKWLAERRIRLTASQFGQICKAREKNKLEDPLAAFPVFKKYERNGLSVTLETKRVGDLDEKTVNWAYELTKSNMKDLYEMSEWGWKDRDKMEEMTEEKAWYLIARDQDGRPVAFSHFRFDMELDTEVLYCYEIQLCPDVRKKGLGKFMMQILELMANKYEMKSVMLTVFKHNQAAHDFFVAKLKYSVDEISPEQGIYDEEDYTYQILSKLTKTGREAAAAAEIEHGACAKTCCTGNH